MKISQSLGLSGRTQTIHMLGIEIVSEISEMKFTQGVSELKTEPMLFQRQIHEWLVPKSLERLYFIPSIKELLWAST